MSSLGLDPQHTRRMLAIGHICVQWSALEHHLAVTVWTMLGISKRQGKILTGGLGMQQRLNMALALARGQPTPTDLTAALKKIRKEIQDGLDDTRNRAVHGVGFSEGGAYAGTEVHRGRGAELRLDIAPEDFEEAAARLMALSEEFLPVCLAFQRAAIDRKKLEGDVLAIGAAEVRRRAGHG